MIMWTYEECEFHHIFTNISHVCSIKEAQNETKHKDKIIK